MNTPTTPPPAGSGLGVTVPEACAEALGQLGHDGVALVLDGTERRQVAVVAQHGPGAGVAVQGSRRICPRCRPAPQPPRHLHEGLQLPQERLHAWRGPGCQEGAGSGGKDWEPRWGEQGPRGRATDEAGPDRPLWDPISPPPI